MLREAGWIGLVSGWRKVDHVLYTILSQTCTDNDLFTKGLLSALGLLA